MIDWQSRETHVLLNPRMPAEDRARLQGLVSEAPPLDAHVWLATSGTTGALKLTALSKRALLTSAAAVNRHLQAEFGDVWGCVLPTFHVGGLGIHARAWLNGARVVEHMPWSPAGFVELCERERVSLTSLVPTQLSDLVAARLRAPASVRAAVIGGGALAPALYDTAQELGWPVLPSYGMTECCSQVATARPGSPDLVLLDHVEVRTGSDGRLAVRSDALLTGYAIEGEGFVDPRSDGWFVTEDLGTVEDGVLRVVGRRGDFVKIGGESVDLARLDRLLAEIVDPSRAALAVSPDERLGHVIVMAFCDDGALLAVEPFNRRVLPFERIRRTVRVGAIPRTELGKLARKRLQDLVR